MNLTSRWAWALYLFTGALALSARAQAQPREVDVPPALESYRGWVLHGVDDFGCVQRDQASYCVWPATLELELTETGGRFAQRVQVDRKDTPFELPGARGRFPLDVRVGGRPVPVVEGGSGAPTVLLERGTHDITGSFAWKSLPERLEVPRSTALIELNVLGQAVPFPKRDENGQLWLQGSAAADPKGEQLAISVSRMLEDGVPLIVTTRIELRIAGRAREINLGRVLLPGTTPLSLDSGLPARLEEGGELRVQASAGTYELRARARVSQPASDGGPEKLAFKKPTEAWPESETWVWRSNEKLRQVELSGAPAIDPGRTELPTDWLGMPTYLLGENDALILSTVRRGEPAPPPNHVTLQRELWLDLDGSHFTVRDQLQTELRDGFRLDLTAGQLGHVSAGGEDLLITKHGKHAGVELRDAAAGLTAEWRTPRGSDLPAVGWSEDVQSLQTTLHLGPGYSLLAARGVDQVSTSWLQDWDLYDFFFVLVIAIAALRLIGKGAAALALLTLVLCHQQSEAPGAVWLALLAWIALLRVLPAGWFRNLARLGYAATAIALLLIAVPFIVHQARIALYPQLDDGGSGFDMTLSRAAVMQEESPAWLQEPGAPPPVAAPEQTTAPSAPSDEDAEGGRGRRADEAKAAERLLLEGARHSAYGGAVGDALGISVAPQKQLKRATLMQDPEAAVQTGPGVPTWGFRTWQLSWSGPVDSSHKIQLYLITPLGHRLMCLGRIASLLALAFLVLRAASTGRDKPSSLRPPQPPAPAATSAVIVLLAIGATLALAGSARAQTPAPELLDELRRRLTERRDCGGRCASIAELAIDVRAAEGGTGVLTMTLDAHATEATTLALPGPTSTWVPRSVTLDRKPAAIALLDDGFLHVRVPAGVHTIEASGPLPESDALTLSLRDAPIRARVTADGYKVDGVREDGQVEGTVQIARLLDEQAAESPIERAALPPFLRVVRKLELGPRWTMHSTVERVSPAGSPIRVSVPLLPGESVNDGWLEVADGALQVSLGRDDHAVEWTSTIKPGSAIELRAPEGKPFTETWTIACGPIWRCVFEGIAPLERVSASTDESGTSRRLWQPTFAPWPGESVRVSVTRPESAGGPSVTIDSATLSVTPGVRMQQATLDVALRTSRGASHGIQLPKDARVQTLTVNGEARPIRLEKGKLSVTLGPGQQNVRVEWQAPSGMGAIASVPEVALDRPATNVALHMNVPEDRWLLWASGPSWGPAILFWGYLLMVVLAAFALARTQRTPLSVLQWLLLGLGLTQVPAFAALCVVAWFFAMQWRKTRPEPRSRFVHNVTQLLLVWLTVAALGCLYAAVHSGLLVQPDMQVTGGGSSSTLLRWYVDRIGGELPSATIVSVPLWVFRLLMLSWSLWLAASIVRWLPWAFSCFKEGGLWKSGEKKKKPPSTPPRSMPPAPPPITVPPPAPPPSGTP